MQSDQIIVSSHTAVHSSFCNRRCGYAPTRSGFADTIPPFFGCRRQSLSAAASRAPGGFLMGRWHSVCRGPGGLLQR